MATTRTRTGARNPRGAATLRAYWTTGQGGTTKVRWNTPGDHTRCTRQLRKYLGPRAAGYCNRLHKAMTGVYAGDRRNIGRVPRRRR
ncbi:hypothetical protein [Embleya sp. NPDC059237]|uniref:hypothetical protein n=1 Tax=Embleya sp. NPDC059237 TaxID=3346784 RepID=UPI0036C1D8D6